MTDDAIPISRVELIAILAMLAATVAFSIDAMLPAFPHIGADLSPNDLNRVQLVIAAFMVGLGLGTVFAGPLSDAFGRQPVAVVGSVIIIGCALTAAFAPSLEVLLVARFVQGIGSAGPRIAGMAIVRDLFHGREMARILSFVIFVFTLAPVFAPSIGWLLTWAFGWRAIFLSFAVFSVISMIWLLIRLPETLAADNRRPFRVRKLRAGFVEVFCNRQVVLCTLAQTLVFGILMATLMSSQQIFEAVFDKTDSFPLWFGFMAFLAAGSNLINAAIVVRVGMRNVVKNALLVQGGFTGVFLISLMAGLVPGSWLFPVSFFWLTSIFYLAGFGIGNLNAMAMEPMGHMAGLAASIITATATVASLLIAVPIGQAFDGTLVPLAAGVFLLAAAAFLLVSGLSEDGV